MKKVTSLVLALALCLMMVPPLGARAAETLSMLHTEGNKIVNAEGEQITLRGTNLGGWLMQEGWLSPLRSREIDHAYISEIIATCSNGDHTAEKAFDTIIQNGLTTNNMLTYWQSDKAQDNDNMELKIVLDKPRTFNSIVVETDPDHTGDYLRGGIVWIRVETGGTIIHIQVRNQI